MMRAFRRTSLATVFSVIALFATMPVAVSSWLHDVNDDVLCGEAIVVHDPDAHQFSASRPASQESQQHCVLCHTLQSLRAVHSAVRFAPPLADAGRLSSASVASVQTGSAAARPARAPPLA